MKTSALMAALGALAMAGSASAASLIVNGDFSSPNYGGGWGASNAVPGWTNAADGGEVETGASSIYGLPCYSSDCTNLEVNYVTLGSVSQTVNGLMAGHVYTLSWAYGGRPGGGAQSLNVSWDGNVISTDTGSYGTWTLYTFKVKALGGGDTLTFTSTDAGGLPGYGNEVTAVSLVPEPATWALMIGGLGLTGFALRRRAGKALAV